MTKLDTILFFMKLGDYKDYRKDKEIQEEQEI